MINHIQKDLLKKHTGPFLFCFFTVMFILLMQFLILHVDKLVGKGLPFSIVIDLILNNLAYMVVLAVPMAVLVSTLMAFGRFSEWNELTAVKAAGINPFGLMKPVLFVSILLFAGLSFFSNNILPEANHKARSLFLDIRTQKPGFDLQPGVFYDGIDGYTFLVREIPAGSDTLYDVTLFQEAVRDRNRAYIKADRGWLYSPDEVTLSLYLEEGTITQYLSGSRQSEETVEKSSFNRHRISFDLSDLAFSRSNPEQRSRNDRTMSAQAMLALIDTLSLEKEKEFTEYLNKTDQLRSGQPSFHLRQTAEIEADQPAYDSPFVSLEGISDIQRHLAAVNHALTTLTRNKTEIESISENLRWRQERIASYMVEVHKKFSIPFACIIFVLLGAPIGMMTRKGNIGFAAITGLVLLAIYFVAIIQGEKLADRLIVTPFIGMWGINILLGVIGLLLTLHVCTSLSFRKLLNGGRDEQA